MEKSIKKNYLYNVLYQIVSLIVPFITTPYISRVLGVSNIGIYSYTYAIVRYFWFASILGISSLGTRTIGIYQKDRKERTKSFWNLFILKIILSSISIIIYIIYAIIFSENKLITLIQGIYLIAVLFDITWFFQGMEDYKKITIKNLIIKFLNVVFIFVFVKSKEDLPIYIFGLAAFMLLGNLSLWLPLRRYVDKFERIEFKIVENLKLSLQLFIPSVAVQIFSVLDKSMIGWITNDSSENGYYEQALKIVDMTLVLITTMGTIMIPKISREYKNGNMNVVKNCLDDSFKFIFLLAIPMTFGVIIIAPIFVPIFFGNEYNSTVPILQVLSLLYVFMGITNITGAQYLISTSQQKKHTKFLLYGGAINVSLNILLIPRFAAVGAAIASVTGEACVAFFELYYLNKTKQYEVKKLISFMKNYLLAGGIMFFTSNILMKNVNSLWETGFIIGMCIIIYFSIIIIRKDEYFFAEFSKIIQKIKKSKEEV